MPKPVLFLLVLVLVNRVMAQDVSGTWSGGGSYPPGEAMTTVMSKMGASKKIRFEVDAAGVISGSLKTAFNKQVATIGMDNVNQDFTLAGKFDTRSGTLLLVVTHIKNAGDSIAKGKAFTKPDSLYYDLVIKQEKDTVRLTARANKRTNPNAAGEWIGSSTGTGLGMNITEKLNMHILPLKIQMEKTITPQPVAVKRDTIPTRKIEIQKTLVLDTSYITIDLYDNGVIDGDIATVLLDGKPILEKKLLSTQAASISLNLSSDPAEHILELFAENMGSIPPNTALLVLTCKRKRYEINLSSSEAVNGSVLLKFRKP